MYLRMIAIWSAVGARRRTLRTSRSASSSASIPRKSCGDLGSAITNVQRTPSGSSSLAAKAGNVTSVLYSSSPIKKTARGRSSGLNWNAGWPVRSVDVIVGATYFSMCSTIRLVPSKWLT